MGLTDGRTDGADREHTKAPFPRRAALPKISVVVPVFNKAAWLGLCLDSILTQSFADIEVLCVDDASTDGSRALLEHYANSDDRVRIVCNPVNAGAGPARNRGIRAARGRYVQLVDADDLLGDDALRSLYALAESSACPAVRGSLAAFPDGPVKAWIDSHCAGAIVTDRARFNFRQEPKLWLPWFHQTWLLRCDFLLANAIEYPNLREGEDPVFLAAVLTRAPLLSTTSRICYRYRTDLPSPHKNFAHIKDYALHLRLVREIFVAEGCAAVWQDGCSEFYLAILGGYIQDVRLNTEEIGTIADILAGTWAPSQLAQIGIVKSGKA